MQPDEFIPAFVEFHAEFGGRARRRLIELLLDGDDLREQVLNLSRFVERLEAALDHEGTSRVGSQQLWLAGMRDPGWTQDYVAAASGGPVA